MLGLTTGRGLVLVDAGAADVGAEELEFLRSLALAVCEEPGAGKDLLAACTFSFILVRGFSDFIRTGILYRLW